MLSERSKECVVCSVILQMLSSPRLLCRQWRGILRRGLTSRQLIYDKYGDPHEVLQLREVQLPDNLSTNQVQVKWLAAPINPADVNQVEGKYPIKPKLPAVGGSEGVAEVEAVGSAVNTLTRGDWVVAAHSGLGCWQTRAIYSHNDLIKIHNDLPLEAAATFQVNPPTAYRMLKDFVSLQPGDTIIQNGANSAVGRAAIQLAHAWGIRSVNVIRDRADVQRMKTELMGLGADYVLTENELELEGRRKAKGAKLALNCVGGRNAMHVAACLDNKGVMVTYGGMSKQPIQVPTGPLIFKDVSLVGFWMSRWYTFPHNTPQRELMFNELAQLVRSGNFKTPHFERKSLDNWKDAMKAARASSEKKQLLVY